MLEKLIYANLGYESNSFKNILKLQNQLKEYNPKIDILEINKEIKEEKANIIKESELSETEVNKFFEENEILSTTSNNGLNAVIFRNKTTNEIEISVGGTDDVYDVINNAALVTTGYPFSQGIELNNFIKEAEENGLIKPNDKINLYGHSLGKAIIETTLITYYANDSSKLEQINQLNYFNGVSISRNNNFLINLNGLQDQNISTIQNLYNKENLVNDIIVDSGFDVVPNSILTGLLSRTLITDDIRIGVGFDSENVRLNYNYHFLSTAYKILKADNFVLNNNLSETDKQNLYNIYNVNFNNGTDIEKFENLLLLYPVEPPFPKGGDS